jgi:hypothetical protein
VLIEGLLRRQAGVISRAQAIERGMSADAVQRKLGSGRWERLHPGVYLAADHEYGDEARLRAAMLWAGEGATAHGLSAAWWHGIVAELPATVQITVPRARRAGRRAGLLVRRRDLATADHVPLRLLQVTDVPLTVLEAAISLGPAGSALLDRALQRTVRFPAVYRAHCRNLGRRGSPAASALLTAAADRAASQAERRLVRLLREHGRLDGAQVHLARPGATRHPGDRGNPRRTAPPSMITVPEPKTAPGAAAGSGTVILKGVPEARATRGGARPRRGRSERGARGRPRRPRGVTCAG